MASQPSRKAKKRTRVDSEQLERLDSLPWNSSLPNDNDDDLFSLLIGPSELEGGFLTLEEIDESEYGLEVLKPERENYEHRLKEKTKSKKRKRSEGDGDVGSGGEVEEKVEEEEEE
ncbi:unnamed protein product, partial [Ilex paraguariensis]